MSPTPRRPNFLIFLADDLAWSDTGCFGGEINTPNIDKLGYDGLRFTDFHASALCSPTRAMLLTGTDHHLTGFGQLAEFIKISESHSGKPGHEGFLNDRVATFPQLLQDAGYFTVMSGKWHLGYKKAQSPPQKGFDRSFAMLNGCCSHYAYEPPVKSKDEIPPFFNTATAAYHREDGEPVTSLPDGWYSSDFYADKLIEYLDEHQKAQPDQPFFAYLPFTAAHWPIQAPLENSMRYRGRYDAGPAALRTERIGRQKRMGLVPEDVVPHPVVAPGVPAWEDMTDDARARSCRIMEVYAGMVERMDENVGKVVEYLKKSGQHDDTYIIFMSDNGAEGAALEASSVMQGATLAHMQEHYDNSLENIGRPTSYCWYGPLWGQAGTAPSRLHKQFSTEGGIRVPFVLSKPGLARPGGGLEAPFCTVMDLAPTILQLAGAKAHGGEYKGRNVERLRGASWADFLADPAKTDIHGDDYEVGWELVGCGAFRKGFWKIDWVPPPMGPGRWELFDLAKDPGETEDLADKNPDKLKELVGLWEKYADDVGVVGLMKDIKPFKRRALTVEETEDIQWLQFMHAHTEHKPNATAK